MKLYKLCFVYLSKYFLTLPYKFICLSVFLIFMKKIIVYAALAIFAISCKSLPKEGKSFFDKAHYESAIPIYKSILSISTANEDQKREASFMLAECYRLSNRIKESAPYYKMAIDLGQVKGDPLFYYAQALKAQGKYEEAAKVFEQFYQGGGTENLVRLAKKEKDYLPKIKEAVTTKSFTTIANCEGINTATGDYAPAILQKKVVFTSSRRNEKTFLTNGLGFNDLYVFNITDSAKCEGDIIPFFNQNINAYGSHESSATFSPDGKTMIFARSNKGEKKEILKQVKLFKSTFNGTEWTSPTILSPISTDTLDIWDSNPALSPDGNTLYFSSNRQNDSYGNTDLFKATKEANGGWGNIENLGKSFNTEGREDFPYMSPDGRFFFASESHGSLGGLDIFVVDTVKVIDETTKKEVKELKIRNVGVPMNSIADDFGIAFTNKTDGYFSSNRTTDGAKGDDDIFAFRNDSIYQKTVKYYLQGITYKKDIKGVETILGEVKVDLKNDKGEVIESIVSDDNGKFKFTKPVLIDKNYMVFGTKSKEFLDDDTLFSTVGKGVKDITKLPKKDNEIWFDTKITLRENFLAEKKDKKGEPIVPEITILYDYDKADIRPDAAAILDEFYGFLKDYFAEYPDQVLEMGSHTDSRGNDKYNQKLAQRRADSAVAYLIKQGVSPERIKAKGYGESELKIKNAKNEAEHQQNRRTTVKIIKK
jgi:peptidoglycan-associated lipoprotein